uniref:NADH-ubiquinone oxidoreductase chain 4 n=1 Tax=Yanocephalus yanonis TaxID=317752 RepID=A0A343KJ52_9HEMI|nr:NADH dehydrogenase subunit 4 [Yanocephalus yanonis]ATG83157.1 NADH dehydrogenase subunit 4 [Yanocephalus yanonis]
MKFIFFLFFLIHSCLYNKMMLLQYFFMVIYVFYLYSGCFEFFNKVSYLNGVDNFSYNLILLSFLISSFMILSMIGCNSMFMFLFINLLLSLFLVFIFSSLSFMYMYMYFEFVLVPLMVLILGWGYQPERLISGMYLFFYTVLVSLPLLLLLLYLYICHGSLIFDLMNFTSKYFLIHFFFIVVFMVKLPMCFFHYWLPKAHVQAPVSGSMILAGLMLKIGGYGLIRVSYIYEYMYLYYSYIWFTLSMVGSLMISVICLVQADMKCLIAYSSVSHMGMVIMGLMTLSSWGLWGSFYLMLGHGFCSSGLFYAANLYYIRTGSRSFFINKGLLIYLPSCSMFFFLLCVFNMSCPPSLNFVSELMILMSLIKFWSLSSLFFMGISFFCACFSYYLYSYSQHGLVHNLYSFSGINLLEFLCLFMHLLPLLSSPLIMMCLM